MNISLAQLSTFLFALGAAQAATGYDRKAADRVKGLQRAASRKQEARVNGRATQATKQPKPVVVNQRGGKEQAAQAANLQRDQRAKGKTIRKSIYAPAVVAEKRQDQFLPPGLAPAFRPDENAQPGFAWQQPTITLTVTRGFARETVTSTKEVVETRTLTNTVEANVTEYATSLIPVESFTTLTATDYSTTYETAFVGGTSTVEEHQTATEQVTESVTETVGPITTITTDSTAWQTVTQTETEYTVTLTVTSTIPFSTSTVLHDTVTTTAFAEAGPTTVFETTTVDVSGVTTVYGTTTVTEYEVVYETPGFY